MIAALLLGLAAVGPAAPVETRRQSIFVAWDVATRACMSRINGVETGDIGTDAGKAALMAAVPDKGGEIHLLGATDVPYRCMIGIVDTLKHAGYYGRIAFISDWPAPPR